jgi:hypothetical protein
MHRNRGHPFTCLDRIDVRCPSVLQHPIHALAIESLHLCQILTPLAAKAPRCWVHRPLLKLLPLEFVIIEAGAVFLCPLLERVPASALAELVDAGLDCGCVGRAWDKAWRVVGVTGQVQTDVLKAVEEVLGGVCLGVVGAVF